LFANRNGFYYTLDRTTGKIIVARPFVETTWSKEIGRDGRPVLLPGHVPDEKGEVTCPELTGRQPTSGHPVSIRRPTPSSSNARETCMNFIAFQARIHAGRAVHRRLRQRVRSGDSPAWGAACARSIPTTGERKWEFKFLSPSTSGVLTTASGLLFSGDGDGNLIALDSRSGKLLWHYQMGATLHGNVAHDPIWLMGGQHLLVPFRNYFDGVGTREIDVSRLVCRTRSTTNAPTMISASASHGPDHLGI
jgi:alcohol dehydrogenase (cytochrome c)